MSAISAYRHNKFHKLHFSNTAHNRAEEKIDTNIGSTSAAFFGTLAVSAIPTIASIFTCFADAAGGSTSTSQAAAGNTQTTFVDPASAVVDINAAIASCTDETGAKALENQIKTGEKTATANKTIISNMAKKEKAADEVAQTRVDAATGNVNAKESEHSTATIAYNDARIVLDSAQKAYDAAAPEAKAALLPALDAAKAAVEKAKIAKEAALKALNDANSALTSAKNQANVTKDALAAAETAKTAASSKNDTLVSAVESAKTALAQFEAQNTSKSAPAQKNSQPFGMLKSNENTKTAQEFFNIDTFTKK